MNTAPFEREDLRFLPSLAIAALFLLGGCSHDHEHEGKPSADGHDHGPDEHDDEHDDEHEAREADDEGHDGHDDHVGRVELTESQLAAAEIETTTAGPRRVTEGLTLTGSVAPNADAVLHVTPRVSGQVRSVFKELGERVEEGELLCVLDSVELGNAVAAFLRERAMVKAAEETLESERELYGRRLLALERVLEGAITVQEGIHAREADLREKEVSTVRPLLEAEKALQLAKLDKDERLTDLRAERDARVLAQSVSLEAARIDLAAAKNRLRALGLAAERIDALDDGSPLLAGEYHVTSPGSGIVVDRHVYLGEFVDAGAKLYLLEDLANVWFVARAYEEQLRAVRSGQPAAVTLDAFPGTTLPGTVSFLDYHVDRTSRSVGVRITLDNERLEGWSEELPLRPGMFGKAELETAAREAAVVVPEAALVHRDDGDAVFVRVGKTLFERRPVVARDVAGGLVDVTAGLSAGDEVVVAGTFLLESASRAEELGGGHSH